MSYAVKLDKESKINLQDYDPSDTNECEKDKCLSEIDALSVELSELQEILYAAQKHSVLIVLQGMDTSGKDGTISHVMSAVNPQSCDVAAFKIPTPDELAHDFLWRAHKQTPTKGHITIFNRSHYEDVLVTRVHNLIDKDTCRERYAHIRNFEQLLTDNSTIVMKFYLHISKDEQKQRLLDRENDATKSWKLSAGDWEERKLWDKYVTAYEDALGATAAKDAPWYIVPANHKWYRNLAIARVIVENLRPYKKEAEKALKELGEQKKAELAEMRKK